MCIASDFLKIWPCTGWALNDHWVCIRCHQDAPPLSTREVRLTSTISSLLDLHPLQPNYCYYFSLFALKPCFGLVLWNPSEWLCQCLGPWFQLMGGGWGWGWGCGYCTLGWDGDRCRGNRAGGVVFNVHGRRLLSFLRKSGGVGGQFFFLWVGWRLEWIFFSPLTRWPWLRWIDNSIYRRAWGIYLQILMGNLSHKVRVTVANMPVYYIAPSDSSLSTGGAFKPSFSQGGMLLLPVAA